MLYNTTVRRFAPLAGRVLMNARRNFSATTFTGGNKRVNGAILGAAASIFAGISVATGAVMCEAKLVNWEKVREDIASILDEEKYDDGHIGPLLIRLAWHASGTYCAKTKTGGSDGATMRFSPECDHGANAGLIEARKRLDKIAAKHPGLSVSDLWILASYVAIEDMGGPKIPFVPGRKDKPNGEYCTPDGRLPAADKGTKPATIAHIRDIFYRMGFNDQEIVALLGAHAMGRCHTDRSGYEGPWTRAPTTFSNEYYKQLINTKWVKKQWNGPLQYENVDGRDLMMLPTDLALVEDPHFKKYVELYAKDENRFFSDFAAAYKKLTELGCQNLSGKKGWLW